MKDKKNLIVDYLYDELPESEKHLVEKIIARDGECNEFYKEMSDLKTELKESVYNSVSDERLEIARAKLFNSLPQIKRSANSGIFMRTGKEILKYVAVALATFGGVNYYHNTNNTGSQNAKEEIVGIPMTQNNGLMQSAAFEGGNDNNYKVSNLDISREGDELVMAFDVSASKVIRGTKDDPAVIYTLDQLMKSSSDPAVKLRTLKYVEKARDPKLQKGLLALIKDDKDISIRRKALKIIGNGKIDDDVKNTLLELIAKDKDQVMRIEALNILENYDEAAGQAAVKDLGDDDNELLRFKSDLSRQ